METGHEIDVARRELAAAALGYFHNGDPNLILNAAKAYAEAHAAANNIDLVRDRIDKWLHASRNVDNPTMAKGRLASDAIAILLEYAGLFRMAGRMREVLAGVEQTEEIKTILELIKAHNAPPGV